MKMRRMIFYVPFLHRKVWSANNPLPLPEEVLQFVEQCQPSKETLLHPTMCSTETHGGCFRLCDEIRARWGSHSSNRCRLSVLWSFTQKNLSNVSSCNPVFRRRKFTKKEDKRLSQDFPSCNGSWPCSDVDTIMRIEPHFFDDFGRYVISVESLASIYHTLSLEGFEKGGISLCNSSLICTIIE